MEKEKKITPQKKYAKDFIDFTYNSGSTYHAVKLSTTILEENGFERVRHREHWNIKEGGKYFVKRTNSSFIAFTVGKKVDNRSAFRLIGTHTDAPCFKIKPKPEMLQSGYLRLNTEVYGSPIISTWFDRPLSIAGRVIIRSNKIFQPKTINIKIDKPLMIIPNLAIHMNSSVNNGFKFDKQNDVLPILKIIDRTFERDNYLIDLIADQYNIKKGDILDFDLFLYNFEKGTLIGPDEEFISAPRIDNLASVYSSVYALVDSGVSESNINVIMGFDNEEVGSSSKQGADSNYLTSILERVFYSLGKTREQYLEAIYRSFMISADGAHAVHPAHPEKSDPIIQPKINGGVVLKTSAAQKYSSDGYSISLIKQLVGDKLKLQYFVNNSRYGGGSTLGPLASTHFDADSVDIGIPMLSMHSIRELCGVDDFYDFKQLMTMFFQAE